MKAVVVAVNQEKALVGACSVITKLRMDLFEALVQAQPEPRVTTRTLDFSPRLVDANERYVILREEEGLQGLKVLDQRSNEIWDLKTNCGPTDGFFMWHGQCTEDLIVTTYDEKSHTHLGVWHAPTRKQILKQQLPSKQLIHPQQLVK